MRLKLANTLGNRGLSTDKDERILNGIVEAEGSKKEDGSYVMKRPACVSSYVLTTGVGGTTQGQGLFVINTPGTPGIASVPSLVGIRGDRLTIPV